MQAKNFSYNNLSLVMLSLTLLTIAAPPTVQASKAIASYTALSNLFEGGSNSLVDRGVGAAEGTRTINGGKTWAYAGHTDPGNGAANQGTFSYQHAASSPEEADQKQRDRLRRQAEQMMSKAEQKGVKLDTFGVLAGVDLYNQAPAAGNDYVTNWMKCQDATKSPREVVLCARTKSYVDPTTGALDAPGLGNDWARVKADQERRIEAIAKVLEKENQ